MTPAIQALEKAGIVFEILSYEHDPRSPAYGLEAAEILQLDHHSVFKTLLAELEPQGLAVAIIPVSQRLNLKAVAKALGMKRAHMADPKKAERTTGYVVGGISPIGQKKQLPTLIDESALELESIHVSAGRRGLEVHIQVTDLITICKASTAALT